MNKIPYYAVEWMRQQFPKGSVVVLNRSLNASPAIIPGTTGELMDIDSAGSLLVEWPDGRQIPLIIGMDDFHIMPPAVSMVKYYMPMAADIRDETPDDDDMVREELWLSSSLVPFYGDIADAWQKYDEKHGHATKGIMEYYMDEGNVKLKVPSCRLGVELRGGKVWGTAICMVIGSLTEAEEETLKEYIEAQCSDGYADVFSQDPLTVYVGGIYIEANPLFWNQDSWFIKKEEDLFPA